MVKDLALSLLWLQSLLMAWVPCLAFELLHVMGVARKKQQLKKTPTPTKKAPQTKLIERFEIKAVVEAI